MAEICAAALCGNEGIWTVTGTIPTIAGNIAFEAKICEEHYRAIDGPTMAMSVSLLKAVTPEMVRERVGFRPKDPT